MKRTALKRGTTSLKRTRINPKRATPRRVAVLRDRAYLDWLKSRRCIVCWTLREPGPDPFNEIVDPAHGPSNGTGSKGPDNEAVPLCRQHHAEQHAIGWTAFEAKYGFSREREAAAHWAVYRLERGENPCG